MGVDLSLVCKGFEDPVQDAQRCFRTILSALSQPGTVGCLDTIAPHQPPDPWSEAAWAVAMTLLDGDTRVWLSPSLATAAAHASLQFHTSCNMTKNPAEADFAFVGHPGEQPDWSSLRQGEPEFPDLSATIILQVPGITVVEPSELSGGESPPTKVAPNVGPNVGPNVAPNASPSSTLQLQGPGIEHTRRIRLERGAEGRWAEQLRLALVANRSQFPLGVDLLMVWSDRLCAIPRSTRVAAI